jgi:hypothetical protein
MYSFNAFAYAFVASESPEDSAGAANNVVGVDMPVRHDKISSSLLSFV